ncbi:1,2-dihydroxy-3-keto-5-methylthiopentene dioxygenase [Algibacillus agarilyticus]|uniref:1,2-dihydroxy-3-keto-5-methylthiopentene dioxygenase n=1 Tax=Algibacillus agarilyticus TaxID=2234133 RepID=UPI000DD0CE6B|nr:acireductone dioxygenase [Algibacillus agarilyticus]
MSKLTIYNHADPIKVILESTDLAIIAKALYKVGVLFEHWQTLDYIRVGESSEDILAAYQSDIQRIKKHGEYSTVDVISLAKGNVSASELRAQYLFEHTHDEDEVRFFVKGQGLFCLHIGGFIYQVLCQEGDLISIPKQIKHWFDMGSDPEFTVIRFFCNDSGWVAKSTDDIIASLFPTLD